jgi:signal transduction histidine kinase
MTTFKSTGSTLAMLLGLATIVAVGSLAYRNTNSLYETQRWVTHTHEVIESFDDLQIAMNDAVARRRSFGLTGDETQYRSYLQAVARASRHRAVLEHLTQDNSRQQGRLDQLRALVDARLAQLDAAARARSALGFDGRREAALVAEGSAQSEHIQSLIEMMKNEERELLARRQQAARADSQTVKRVMIFGFSVSVGVLLVAFLVLRWQGSQRAGLASENARLLNSAQRHADDLREANQQMVSATIRAQELTDEAESARARIEHSEHELRMVGEFRETFMGILGHDLRNPLASISMAARLLLRHPHADEQENKAMARIIRGCQRMARMISQLLDLTRTRLGGGFPLEPKLVDLRDMCRNVVDEFEAPIELEVEGEVTGYWDPDRLEEVLSNITGNAVEHAAPGTPLAVKVRGGSAEVVVEISNRGTPIPPEVLPFIFEPFRRGKQLEKSPSGSLGLGLYIAKQIMLSHGGTLEAHSADGTTTFTMRLPRRLPPVGLARLNVEARDQYAPH